MERHIATKAHVELWDAINELWPAGNFERRMQVVPRVEQAVSDLLRDETASLRSEVEALKAGLAQSREDGRVLASTFLTKDAALEHVKASLATERAAREAAERSVECQLAIVEHWKAKASAAALPVESLETRRLDWLFKHGPLIAYDTDHRGELVAEWDIEDREDVDAAMAQQAAAGR